MPEYFDAGADFLADDQVPETLLAVLRVLAEDFVPETVAMADFLTITLDRRIGRADNLEVCEA